MCDIVCAVIVLMVTVTLLTYFRKRWVKHQLTVADCARLVAMVKFVNQRLTEQFETPIRDIYTNGMQQYGGCDPKLVTLLMARLNESTYPFMDMNCLDPDHWELMSWNKWAQIFINWTFRPLEGDSVAMRNAKYHANGTLLKVYLSFPGGPRWSNDDWIKKLA